MSARDVGPTAYIAGAFRSLIPTWEGPIMTLAQTALDAVTVGRWQFGVTTVYHFVLVPLTIGLSLLVAIMQTAWHRTGKEYWLQATRFFGKLLLINFALGVATGIVPGVPVRHELVRILPFRRRHLRRSPGR